MKLSTLYILVFFTFIFFNCTSVESQETSTAPKWAMHDHFICILGIAQDGGFPQAGCQKKCCSSVYSFSEEKLVTSLALIDKKVDKKWFFDASPDYKDQLKDCQRFLGYDKEGSIDGIFLSHAHVGHYTGLINLGREIMGTSDIPVYAMPRMKSFLEENGPWSQLVKLNNISIQDLENNKTEKISSDLSVTPVLVPHRDEFSETVGFYIKGPNKTALFIPDIDKWEKWDLDINEEIKKVDYALLDGTFYADGEIPERDMSEIPHPFIVESLAKFDSLSAEDKAKIYFIHLNHTNPLLKRYSEELTALKTAGYKVARRGLILDL